MRFESVIKENRSSNQVLKDEKDAMRLPKTQVLTALTKRTAGEIGQRPSKEPNQVTKS